jgi:hypothetical protein
MKRLTKPSIQTVRGIVGMDAVFSTVSKREMRAHQETLEKPANRSVEMVSKHNLTHQDREPIALS